MDPPTSPQPPPVAVKRDREPRGILAWLRAHAAHLELGAYWSAVTVVMATYFAGCLHGIANFWQWGHNGYNGAAFAQAARNSLRFHTLGQAQYYTGIEPPDPNIIYTHHPMALHFHLMALFKLLGTHEWVGRLVPATYSFLGFLLLFVIVKRTWGKAEALAVAAAYALTPLHVIFANMIDHEQGSIFWCLLFIYSYLRWLETPRWTHAATCMLAVSMAVQFDWPGYYIALFLAIHAFLTGIKRQKRLLEWRREYTFVGVFSVVVLANFAAFFGFILHLRGSFSEMMGAFHSRSSNPEGYYARLGERSVDLYGYLLLGLLALWVLVFLVRLVRWKVGVRDLVPLFFLLAQVVHSLVFKQAGYIHSYWTYHVGPAAAIAAGTLLVAVARHVPRLLGRLVEWLARFVSDTARSKAAHAFAPIRILLAVAILAPPLVYQARYAWKQVQWGFRTGFGSYIEPYNDQFDEIRWVQHLVRHYDRNNAVFYLHPTTQWRIEWLFYLDAPWHGLPSNRVAPTALAGPKRNIYLFDLQGISDQSFLSSAIATHHVVLYDQRFLVIDGDSTKPGLTAYKRVERPAPLWWKWLVNPLRPPVAWLPDPQGRQLQWQMQASVRILSEKTFGGKGGTATSWNCPKGYLLTAFEGLLDPNGNYVAQVRPVCRLMGETGPVAGQESTFSGKAYGGTQGRPFRLECGEHGVIVGLHGRQGVLPDSLGLICARTGSRRDTATGGRVLELADTWRVDAVGGKGGTPFEFACGTGSAAWGFRARTGTLVDAVGVACGEVDQPFFDAAKDIASSLANAPKE